MSAAARTRTAQLAGVALGWALTLSVVLTALPALLGAGVSLVVLAYMLTHYPLACVVSDEGVVVRSVMRSQIITWDEILVFRRTKGSLRRATVDGRRRWRPLPGALLVVRERGRTVLALGHRETIAENREMVRVISSVSPALADMLRLES